ncbi:MAG TPA: ligase-associated DNA damage response endonuclease PdeM, partial [Cyclobacteriaceae bacterium]|nr:ligase-associated DNA damage response endonuclease PdeM [Cyclobacteriaceae bacterium]
MKMMMGSLDIELLPEKALFYPNRKVLILGDLHFGKTNHFRRAGLPVPSGVNRKNSETLIELISVKKPEQVIFLGDLFHSHYNEEWESVGQIVRHFSAIRFELVRGNHDIMSEQQYSRNRIAVCDHLEMDSLWLTHEPLDMDMIPHGKINVAGHIHPGAHLQGKGRQAMTLPCFWLSSHQWILPAFGSFTGLAAVRPREGDRIFIILENKIMEANFQERESKTG